MYKRQKEKMILATPEAGEEELYQMRTYSSQYNDMI